MRDWPIIDIRGDKEECLKWLPYGKTLLTRLVNYMKSAGLQQGAWWGYPDYGVAVLAEKRMAISRIYIDLGRKKIKKFIKKARWYWYHIITGGYRWYINDLCVDSTGMIYIIGGQAATNPAIWYGDYAVVVRYTPEGDPTYVKRWDKSAGFVEDTDFCFGQSIVAGEPGFLYAMVDYARIEASGIYETMLVKLTTGGQIVWDIGFGDSSNWTQVYANNVQYWYEIVSEVRYDYVYSISDFKDYNPTSGGTIVMGLLVKTDENGAVQWKKFMRFDFAASPYWIRADDLSVDNDGNCYVLCRTENDPITTWLGDFSILKFNKEGTLQWKKKYGPTVRTGDIFTVAHEIVADNYDNIYVIMLEKERTGANTGYMKSVLINISPTGTVQWAKKYQVAYSGNEDPFFDVYPRLAEGIGGDIFLLSQAIDDSISEDDDYILSKFNSDGDNVWMEQLHGQDGVDEFDQEIPWGVNIGGMAIDKAGNIVLGGDVYSQDRSFTMKLPDGPLAGTFHNFDFSIPTYTISSHGIDVEDEVDLTIEDATDMDLQTVDYITSPLATETETLYKFLEETQTIEVQDGND